MKAAKDFLYPKRKSYGSNDTVKKHKVYENKLEAIVNEINLFKNSKIRDRGK